MKTIGIVGWADGDIFGVNKKYLAFAQRYGKPRIILPTDTEILDLDLLILPGGPDIPYNTYSDIPDYNLSKQCPFRDHFEKVMLQKYINADTPVFGICRGQQAIAVIGGLNFIPHISVDHPKTNRTNRSEKVHKIHVTNKLHTMLKSYGLTDDAIDKLKVNSLHHQGVEFTNEETIIGYSGEKHKYAEVLYSADQKVAAVAYHPEELDNEPISDMLIKQIIK